LKGFLNIYIKGGVAFGWFKVIPFYLFIYFGACGFAYGRWLPNGGLTSFGFWGSTRLQFEHGFLGACLVYIFFIP
jgi:hypothetical protein